MDGTPYVIRDGNTYPVNEGFVLIDRDKIRDESGEGNTDYLPRGTINIDPNDEHFQRIMRILSGEDD